MSTKQKWITAAVTAVLWAAWLVAYAAWQEHPDIGAGHRVATVALQMAVAVSSIIFALGWMVSPALAVAKVWKEIGIREQQKQCDLCQHPAARAGRLTNYIPTSFSGNVTPIGDLGRNRDI